MIPNSTICDQYSKTPTSPFENSNISTKKFSKIQFLKNDGKTEKIFSYYS